MKKSRVFLGVTAFFLAIAGAFATKAKTFTTSFYYNPGSGYVSSPVSCLTTASIVCTYTIGTTVYTVVYRTTNTQAGKYFIAHKNS